MNQSFQYDAPPAYLLGGLGGSGLEGSYKPQSNEPWFKLLERDYTGIM